MHPQVTTGADQEDYKLGDEIGGKNYLKLNIISVSI